MPVSSSTNRVVYNGDGSSASFAFAYEFHSQADLYVYTYNSSRIVASSTKLLNTDYTILGTADAQGRYTNGALVIFNSSPSATDLVSIVRAPTTTQPFGLQFNQVIPNAELTKALDRLVLIEQRMSDHIGRSIRLTEAFPFTFDPRLPDRLPSGAPIIVSSSGIGISTGVVAVAGTSAATYFGILPPNNGGTGLDFSQVSGLIYSPGNNSTFTNIPNGGVGLVLTANGSSAPSFQSFATTLINSGILSVAFGGTGIGTSYIQNGVLFASSATQLANTVAGGADVPLLGNAGAAPSFKALPLTSNSSVSGILAQIHGGTGTASSFPVAGLIYQDSASAYGFVASAADGRVLTAHGSSSPSFDVAVAANTVRSRTFAYNGSSATISSDSVIFLQGSSFPITLHSAVGSKDQILEFINLGSSIVQSYAINTTGGELVAEQASGTYRFWTQGEKLKIISDNVKWVRLDSESRTGEILVGSATITGTTSNPTPTITTDHFVYTRDGRFMNWRWELIVTAGGGGGSGDYEATWPIFTLLPIDTAYLICNSAAWGASTPTTALSTVGIGASNITTATTNHAYLKHSSVIKILMQGGGVWSSALNALSATTRFSLHGRFPIKGWQP